jgi:hypothetical protein
MDFTGIVAIVMGIGIGMLAIWVDYKRKRLIHEERMEALRQGITPPDWLVEVEEKRKTPFRRALGLFIAAIVLIGIGIWLYVSMWWMGLGALAFWGAGPAFLGLALGGAGLVVYLLHKKQDRRDDV